MSQCHLYCNVKLFHKLYYHSVNYLPRIVHLFGVLCVQDKKLRYTRDVCRISLALCSEISYLKESPVWIGSIRKDLLSAPVHFCFVEVSWGLGRITFKSKNMETMDWTNPVSGISNCINWLYCQNISLEVTCLLMSSPALFGYDCAAEG